MRKKYYLLIPCKGFKSVARELTLAECGAIVVATRRVKLKGVENKLKE